MVRSSNRLGSLDYYLDSTFTATIRVTTNKFDATTAPALQGRYEIKGWEGPKASGLGLSWDVVNQGVRV